MKRKQIQTVKIMNCTAIVFFLPHLSITNTVANIPEIKANCCFHAYTSSYEKPRFLVKMTVLWDVAPCSVVEVY
jgi:hypothetical protein